MSEQLQLRRGTAASIAALTGAQGEPWFDTTNNRLVMNDGSTEGGWPSEIAHRTVVSDANTTALVTDRMIAYTALTAARAVSLPAAASYPPGSRLLVIDESGACSATKTISLTPNGSDDIEGANTSAIIAAPYGFIALESNGIGGWFITDQLAAASAPNGASMQFAVLETLVSSLSGASVNASLQIPANCIVFAVGARVVTAITGATSYEVGVLGNLSQFGSLLSIAAGSINYGLIGPTAFYSATTLTLTAAGGNFTAGAVRLSIHLAYCTPSAS
jgi:Major tropism determinant N-terminal domain